MYVGSCARYECNCTRNGVLTSFKGFTVRRLHRRFAVQAGITFMTVIPIARPQQYQVTRLDQCRCCLDMGAFRVLGHALGETELRILAKPPYT